VGTKIGAGGVSSGAGALSLNDNSASAVLTLAVFLLRGVTVRLVFLGAAAADWEEDEESSSFLGGKDM
jgi:hypothetical protein